MKRRDIIKGLTILPLAGGIFTNKQSLGAIVTPRTLAKRDLFKELGVRTFINARGTITFMTGSLMQDHVLDTIRDTSQVYCMLDELQDKVGERIAKMVHAEAAVVTSGAFSALSLGMAGVLTGMDAEKVEKLPHLMGTGMKSEVIIQKGHRIHYNHALTNCGVKIVYVETREELEKALSDKTALMHFLNCNTDQGKIKHEEWLEVAKKNNIPTMIDIAADVPPKENLWKFNDMGFDLVCISGGKAIRGPQSSGILMGKKDLIAAARLSSSPRGGTIGRGMKVNKEEILGLYMALENYIGRDHDKEWQMWEAMVAYMERSVKNIKGIQTRVFVPAIANHTPTLQISWDTSIISLTTEQLQLRLRNGTPSIEINPGKNSIQIAPWMMLPGQEKQVASRLLEEFKKV
jgi:L-seryl-tRNA(Ser) seleniumtransferase